MRSGVLVAVGASALAVTVSLFACSSSSDNAGATPDAGGDALAPPPETDGGGDAAVDASAVGPADPTSGTRIQALYDETADGARLFGVMHDTLLNLDCIVHEYDDGTLRCIPFDVVPTSGYYEAGCTKPVAIAQKDACLDTTYALEVFQPQPAADPCAVRDRVYHIAGPTTAVYVKDASPSGCSAATLAANQAAFTLGAPVAASELAKFTVQTLPITAAIGARVPVGEDGRSTRRSRCSRRA